MAPNARTRAGFIRLVYYLEAEVGERAVGREGAASDATMASPNDWSFHAPRNRCFDDLS